MKAVSQFAGPDGGMPKSAPSLLIVSIHSSYGIESKTMPPWPMISTREKQEFACLTPAWRYAMPSLTSMVRSAMHVCNDQPPVRPNAAKAKTHVHGALDFFVAIHAAIPKVADGTCIHTALLSFEFRNELHCAHFRRSAHRACPTVSTNKAVAL
jgi:hypothetical protein